MSDRPTFGSLFSGVGGLDLGLERAGWECRWQVEIDEWCHWILTKHWLAVPKMADVRDFPGLVVGEPVDLICGGFPCQPFSRAGSRRGVEDERWLWPEFARVVRLLRPRFVLVENTTGLASGWGAMGRVLGDLSNLGFDAEWSAVSACEMGAPHARERLFIVAHSTRDDEQDQGSHRSDTFHERWSQSRGSGGDEGRGRWLPEPAMDRVAHGIPRRVVRPALGGLGNAVVPQVAEYIGRRLMATVKEHSTR